MHTFHCPTCGRINRVDAARESAAKCGNCKTAIDVTNHPFLVDDAALASLIASSPVPVLVDFYSDTCGPCRTLAPVLAQLAAKHKGELLIAKVDTQRHQRTAQALDIRGIPALFLYRNGQLVNQTAGAHPLASLEAFVRPHLAAGS